MSILCISVTAGRQNCQLSFFIGVFGITGMELFVRICVKLWSGMDVICCFVWIVDIFCAHTRVCVLVCTCMCVRVSVVFMRV